MPRVRSLSALKGTGGLSVWGLGSALARHQASGALSAERCHRRAAWRLHDERESRDALPPHRREFNPLILCCNCAFKAGPSCLFLPPAFVETIIVVVGVFSDLARRKQEYSRSWASSVWNVVVFARRCFLWICAVQFCKCWQCLVYTLHAVRWCDWCLEFTHCSTANFGKFFGICIH